MCNNCHSAALETYTHNSDYDRLLRDLQDISLHMQAKIKKLHEKERLLPLLLEATTTSKAEIYLLEAQIKQQLKLELELETRNYQQRKNRFAPGRESTAARRGCCAINPTD